MSRWIPISCAWAWLACGEAVPGGNDIDPLDTTVDVDAPDTATPEVAETEARETVRPPADSSQTEDLRDADDTHELEVEVVDTLGDIDSAACPLDTACTFQGYLPPCYRATCNARAACVASRIEGCCLADAECTVGDPGPCDTTRCVSNACTTLRLPGCCLVASETCDDGIATTTDRCDAMASRCSNCPEPCAPSQPLLAASFDDPSLSMNALGFFVSDALPNDQVSWQPTTEHFAAGGGALYLGNPRCNTYYGGALDAACAPIDPFAQDSPRVAIGLYAPSLLLPPESPAVLTAWVRAAVQPLAGLGAAEPDVLRVVIETFGQITTQWTVASTLDVGKSTDWVPLAVDLAPWRGQAVRVRFDFDTLDGQDNRYEGVWLDEIVVRETCSEGGCCDDDTDCGAATACTRGACVRTAQGATSVCMPVPATPGTLCTTCADDAACADDDPCTNDTCTDGGCTHEVFCCLERDLLAATFDTNLDAVTTTDDNTFDGVAWIARDGAAWFGDPATDTYGAAGRVAGTLTTPVATLPARLSDRSYATLDVVVRLSTEWDLVAPGLLDNPAGLDRLTIEVLDDAFTTIVWSSDQIGGTTFGLPLPISIDLGPWLGRTIAVRLRFDSGDDTLNTFGGAFIDDLVIGLRCQ